MKNQIIILITTIAFISLASACIKTAPTATCGQFGQLPCPSTTGANVVSCLMNGEQYIVKGNSPAVTMFGCKSGTTFKQNSLTGGYFIDIMNCNQKYRQLHFDIIDTLQMNGYVIGKAVEGSCRLEIDGPTISLYSDSNTIGNISITNLQQHSISGTFNFELIDNNGTKVSCTNGNFDLSK